ncbi:hypothetical protein EYF80_060630 [Liparis tanakae]|uniref:Uncharacterized protein n=1 Tax=Liparis tanakae TaxID=230148 RepID=A0A4Z2ELI4_9TELE|nr:hypothetical protein EYF80_060630 [Liparis tanakae]
MGREGGKEGGKRRGGENETLGSVVGEIALLATHSNVQKHRYHHSLPSSPYSSTAGPDRQRLPPSSTLSSEYLNQGGPTKVLLVICNTAGSGQQGVR